MAAGAWEMAFMRPHGSEFRLLHIGTSRHESQSEQTRPRTGHRAHLILTANQGCVRERRRDDVRNRPALAAARPQSNNMTGRETSGAAETTSKEQADRPPTPTKAGSLRRAPPLHSAAAGRRMASPDRASRNLQLSPKSYELGVQIPLPSAARGPPARLVVPGPRWHPKQAAGLPPGARAAAAEPAAGSLGSECSGRFVRGRAAAREPGERVHRAPPGQTRNARREPRG